MRSLLRGGGVSCEESLSRGVSLTRSLLQEVSHEESLARSLLLGVSPEESLEESLVARSLLSRGVSRREESLLARSLSRGGGVRRSLLQGVSCEESLARRRSLLRGPRVSCYTDKLTREPNYVGTQ